MGVGPGTPAAAACLLVGDILVTFAGTAVNNPEQLLGQLTGGRVGTRVPVTVVRGRDAVEVRVAVGERPAKRDLDMSDRVDGRRVVVLREPAADALGDSWRAALWWS